MQPGIGRIVWYRPDAAADARLSGTQRELLPAIIVAVHSEQCVNLKVFLDGPADLWKTSVRFGKEQGQWCWPQRSE